MTKHWVELPGEGSEPEDWPLSSCKTRLSKQQEGAEDAQAQGGFLLELLSAHEVKRGRAQHFSSCPLPGRLRHATRLRVQDCSHGAHGVPRNDMSKSQPPVPVNVTLFE